MVGYTLAFISGACTGLTVAVGKLSASHLSASMYVFLISILSLVMTYIWRGLTIGWRIPLPHRDLRWLLLWQSLFSAFALWGFWEGARQINTGIASFAVRTELVFVLIASRIFFKEKIGIMGVIGALLIVSGSLAMGIKSPATMAEMFTEAEAAIYVYGLTIVILSGAGFAASECFAKLVTHGIEPSAVVIWRGLILGLIFGALLLLGDAPRSLQSVTGYDIVICALAALLGPILARIFFMWSLRRIELGKAYLLSQNEPVVTALFAWILMNEKMHPADLGGALAILIGCVVISLPSPSKELHSS
jgi:drug/metabolite transporter (DMT)-like permease